MSWWLPSCAAFWSWSGNAAANKCYSQKCTACVDLVSTSSLWRRSAGQFYSLVVARRVGIGIPSHELGSLCTGGAGLRCSVCGMFVQVVARTCHACQVEDQFLLSCSEQW